MACCKMRSFIAVFYQLIYEVDKQATIAVRVMNDTVNLSFNTTSTQLNLTMDDGIWHSSMYSVRVVAENE